VAVLTDRPLVDAHCHPATARPLDAVGFAALCSESPWPRSSGVDGQAVLAVRRWCPPALGLPAHAPLAEYLAARAELGPEETTRRLLRAANLRALLVDTGLPGEGELSLDAMAAAAGAPVAEVVRLEALAERVAGAATASGFADAFTSALAAALAHPRAVAVKSIVAYRDGLDIDPARPTAAEVTRAAEAWLRGGARRLTDPALLRFLLWSAVDAGRPIQLHTGFGDADVTLARADPGLLQPFCAATRGAGAPLVLLHCYPYHRSAGWLAHLYPHVHVDVGLTLNYVGPRAPAVLAEMLELAPFDQVHYSSDGYGPAELHLAGAAQFRHALGVVLSGFVDGGGLTAADAGRIAAGIGADNAVALYGLPRIR